jgi:lysophospholipase L1-like esterase
MQSLLLLFCLAAVPAPIQPPVWTPPRPELADGDRVAFIGNTFVEREQVDDYIETMFISRYPNRNITFRNLGYSADTVTGEARGLCIGWSTFETSDKAFERLKKLVVEYKPTVLLINYGMTESFFGPEKLPEFTANYEKMLDALIAAAGTSPRLVLMTPNYHEDLGRPLPDPTEHNKNLAAYSDAIYQIAAKRKCGFINLFGITKDIGTLNVKATTNGIHLTPFGYWKVAREIEGELRDNPRDWQVSLRSNGVMIEERGAKISDAAAKDGKLSFVVQTTSLPDCPMPAGTNLKDVPPQQIIKIAGLAPGKYQLKAGDELVGADTAENWANGVLLHGGPQIRQAEALRKLIVAKNFDYFNYQRPDNDSYILAFRKREQGRNAVEIPQFLSLVEEKEKQIAALRVPKPVTYTLEKAP